MKQTSQAKRGKTSSGPNSNSNTMVKLSGKPKPREVHPSEIHEYRMKTLQIQNQIKLQRTQLNRLKDKIAQKTEAINKTVSKSNERPESSTIHDTTINQVEKSIRAAQNTLATLNEEKDKALEDDRYASYLETEEELKVTYLEYDRLKGDIQSAKEKAQQTEKQLREIDQRAGSEHAAELKAIINQNRATSSSLREKWDAYQTKLLKLQIEEQIYNARNQQDNSKSPSNNKSKNNAQKNETPQLVLDAQNEAKQIQKDINRLKNKLNKKQEHYLKHVEELIEIIDNQRRRIVDHLMGNDQPQNMGYAEGTEEANEGNNEEDNAEPNEE